MVKYNLVAFPALFSALFMCETHGLGIGRDNRPLGELKHGSQTDIQHPGQANCTEYHFEQQIDHFNYKARTGPLAAETYQERYFLFDKFWTKHANGTRGPILFYAGNEADVTLYVNATGLMWEHAEEMGALLMFAEHRYFGTSLPFGDASTSSPDYLQFLTHEQALADYAALIYDFKETHNAHDSPVVVLGGSYGGMLAAWMRMKYPNVVCGAIAASSPILAFEGMTPKFDNNAYWEVVSRDASPAAGADAGCEDRNRQGFAKVFEMGATEAGREKLSDTFRLCTPMQSVNDAKLLADFLMIGIDYLAMGDFPYPSNYLTNGGPQLPAWPMRNGCKASLLQTGDVLAGLREMSAIYQNATGSESCYEINVDPEYDGIWDYLWCQQTLPQETYFTIDGVRDMFWDRPFNITFINHRCEQKFGIKPRLHSIAESYGGKSFSDAGVTNIFFSNGDLDPWSSGGVRQSVPGSGIEAVTIEGGAHHLDLFFSDPLDPQSVTDARMMEVASMKKWIAEATRKQ